MGGFKLMDGSNDHLFTILKDAASPTFTDITFLANGSAQSGTSWAIYCEAGTGSEGHYLWSCRLRYCHVLDGRSGGLYLGAWRGGGMLEKTWFQYCGQLTTDAAIYCNSFDLQMDMCGIGANSGVGLYLAGGGQIQLSHNICWMNHRNVEIGVGVGDVGFVGGVFDEAADHGVVVHGATASYAHGARTFTGCKGRRNSNAADNTKSDIYVDADTRLILVVPDFQGKHDEANGPKYCIETNGTCNVQLFGYNYADYGGAVGYGTAFTNDWLKITPGSEITQIFADANNIYLDGKIFDQGLRVVKSAGAINAWVDASASNFGFSMVRAEGTGSNVRINVFGKGTGGTQIEVNGGYLTFFGGSVVAKQTVTGSKGANAALTSLIAALVAYGLITDTTS